MLEGTAAFIAIGHEPQSEIVQGLVDTDDEGYVKTDGRPRGRTAPASSPPATSSTTRTARPSRPRARAARRRSTRSGTCATRPRSTRRTRCPRATWPRRSTRRWPKPLGLSPRLSRDVACSSGGVRSRPGARLSCATRARGTRRRRRSRAPRGPGSPRSAAAVRRTSHSATRARTSTTPHMSIARHAQQGDGPRRSRGRVVRSCTNASAWTRRRHPATAEDRAPAGPPGRGVRSAYSRAPASGPQAATSSTSARARSGVHRSASTRRSARSSTSRQRLVSVLLEEQGIRGAADGLLLVGEQLRRAQVIQRLHDAAIGQGAIRVRGHISRVRPHRRTDRCAGVTGVRCVTCPAVRTPSSSSRCCLRCSPPV